MVKEATYDTFLTSLSDLPEGKEMALSVRDLRPGIYKYTYRYVKARVSASPDRYPDGLAIRFGRGQLHGGQYSIEVLEELRRIPEQEGESG